MYEEYLTSLQEAIDNEDTEKMLNYIIIFAIKTGSSDVHVEPFPNYVRFRCRVDGVLKVIKKYPPRLHGAFVSRIKITAGLKIDEKRIPQDGKTPFKVIDHNEEEYDCDIRVSTLPTVTGEKVVMRLANKANSIPNFSELGFTGNNFAFIEELMRNPNGVLVVSGPTGAGKTITLYSIMKRLNTEGVNIVTIEDPVEIEMEGLNQCQTSHMVGLDFALGLRASLRQDPDVIMLGEIRDEETAEVSMHAALTGHLVLSTIHTNSAAETINRLENMGVPKYILASALKGVVAQRLVRKICDQCKEEIQIQEDEFREIQNVISMVHPSQEIDERLLKNPKLYRGKGCSACDGTGYKGRTGIFEILVVKGDMAEEILVGRTIPELERMALVNGMVTLKQDGVLKALSGVTTMEEVYRMSNEK